MISAKQALQRLREGNARYVANIAKGEATTDLSQVRSVAAGQAPFAVVLGCSDSRVPVEIVFDQEPGDLFVVRVAGSIARPSQTGSVEFAVDQFETPLVVVLTHSNCGAVKATIDALTGRDLLSLPNLEAIVGKILPAVEPLIKDGVEVTPELVEQAVHANMLASIQELQTTSPLLQQKIAAGDVNIIGAHYCLETGAIEFAADLND